MSHVQLRLNIFRQKINLQKEDTSFLQHTNLYTIEKPYMSLSNICNITHIKTTKSTSERR